MFKTNYKTHSEGNGEVSSKTGSRANRLLRSKITKPLSNQCWVHFNASGNYHHRT